MERPIWSLVCDYFARLFGHFRYAESFVVFSNTIYNVFTFRPLVSYVIAFGCLVVPLCWACICWSLFKYDVWLLIKNLKKKCRAAWWLHCLESFLIQELSLKWYAGIWERYIHSLKVYSPCILTSFHVYFIIFTPLSSGLMCVMVLADFTISSFVICKHQSFGPGPCGKGTELWKL